MDYRLLLLFLLQLLLYLFLQLLLYLFLLSFSGDDEKKEEVRKATNTKKRLVDWEGGRRKLLRAKVNVGASSASYTLLSLLLRCWLPLVILSERKKVERE
jgi:hypothetical protein